MWDKLNKSWTLALATIVIIAASWGVWEYSHRSVVLPAPAINSLPRAGEGPSIPHGSPTLPQSDEHTTGKTHLHIQPNPVITEHEGKKDTIHIPAVDVVLYLQDDGAPYIHSLDSTGTVLVTYQKVRDPYIQLKLDLLVGVSANPEFQLSPAGMISFATVFSRVRGGFQGDRFGLGPGIMVEVLPRLSMGARWNILSIYPGGKWTGAILYRF